MNAAQVQHEPHDSVVLIKYEPRSAGGSWEEPVSTVRGAPLRRSQRLNSTLDGRSSGQLRNTLSRARELCERWRAGGGGVGGGVTPPPDDEGGGRLSRWFSVRRGSHHQYDMVDSANDKMPKLPELEEDILSLGGQLRAGRRCAPPSLPGAPSHLTPQQLRRRHIVAAIIHSENSYVATLQRLVNDYKKPLEESSPVILNANKISTLFHRLPDILQCHIHFRTALADCARTWDRDEKIGEVFMNAFSKATVLDVYSDFINNFSVAMELAKMESKRKSALADFFKVKQISAHDRLSFFGLMVKPVQRFPQFIMFLQDLLKHTPPGHPDRLSLQRALTRLEALADALNERKRDAERTQAFHAALRRLGARGAGASAAGAASRFASARLLSINSSNRHLLRQDDVSQLEFNQAGLITKHKPRRLLLLNDLVVCVAIAQRHSDTLSSSGPSLCSVEADTERLSLKWAHPVSDVEVLETGSSPTLSRVLAAGMNRAGSLRSNSSSSSSREVNGGAISPGDTLCTEMSSLMHDYETVSRMADLASGLKGDYPQVNAEVMRSLMQQIQHSIQKKDEEMAWADSCCLQLAIRSSSAGSKSREERLTFRAAAPGARSAWATELRLAQLAAAPANSPAWRGRNSTPAGKGSLFVAAQPVYCSQHLTEVRCGCFYIMSGRGSRKTRSLLWLCAADGASSHVAVLVLQAARLKNIVSFHLVETKVTSMEFVKGLNQTNTLCGDTVWLGTDSRKIIIYSAMEPEKQEKVSETTVAASVTQIKYHCDSVFVGLANGTLLVYRRGNDNSWSLQDPLVVTLGTEPVNQVLPVSGIIYTSCGLKVFLLNGLTSEVIRTFDVQCEGTNSIFLMAHSGVGLWITLKNSTSVRLYHTETFEHLQDIDIAADVAKTIGAREGSKPAHVSSLLACQGLLWVGTTAGVSITVPLPRLEGLPLIGGHINVSYHAHAGPVTFLLSLLHESQGVDSNLIRRNISNARAIKETNNNTSLETMIENEKNTSDKAETQKTRFERQISEDLNLLSPQKQINIRNGSAISRRRRVCDARLSKTLPRNTGLGVYDVYGLYGDLMFVKDCANEGDGSGSGSDSLRRSDPELAAIPFRVSTLDRRLRMKVGRPRSLDLSSWSVDSRTSSLCTSSGSEESMALRSISRNSSNASRTNDFNVTLNICNNSSLMDTSSSKSSASDITPDKSISRSNSGVKEQREVNGGIVKQNSNARSLKVSDYTSTDVTRRSVITIMGGRGYVDWRQTADAAERPTPSADPNPKDAHIIIWEMRL